MSDTNLKRRASLEQEKQEDLKNSQNMNNQSHRPLFDTATLSKGKYSQRDEQMIYDNYNNNDQMNDEDGNSYNDDGFFGGPGTYHGGPDQIKWKTVVLAVSLFVLGIVFLVVGFVANAENSPFPEKDRSSTRLAGFILAGLLLIPGSYGLFTIVQIYRRVPGYSWAMLPDPDD